jgi:hypothetical protein
MVAADTVKALRLLACVAAIVGPFACSSKSQSGVSPDPADAGHDGDVAADGDAPDAGTAPEGGGMPPGACVTSGTCPMDSTCCLRTYDGGPSMCTPDPQVAQTCLCATGADCNSGSCAPAVDPSGNPTGPYVCKPDDGSPYQGCVGTASCTAPFCCVTDKKGNQFCAMPCTSDSTCGSGHCNAVDFSASSCTGSTRACGM